MNPFHIDFRSLPLDGKHIEGRLPASFFALTEADTVRALSPVAYSLDITKDGDDLVVTGSLEAAFSLECGRCTGRFERRVELSDYQLELAVENSPTMDLTEAIREDILLALPSYPRCEDGNVSPHPCPAEGKFDAHDEPQPAGDKAWEALDKLKP